jgi:hypothetical protein
MLEKIVQLLFHCRHKHLSRPVAPVRKDGRPQGATYVVCLDCGQPFAYDSDTWKVGQPIATRPVNPQALVFTRNY